GTGSSRTRRRATTPDQALSRGLGMAVYPQHLLLSRRLLRYPWTPQVVSDPPVHDFEGRLDCRGLHAYGLGTGGPDVCHSGAASVGVGVCGHHGVRIELHALHSDLIFWGGPLVSERDHAEHKVDRGACMSRFGVVGLRHFETHGARLRKVLSSDLINFRESVRVKAKRTGQAE